MKIWADILVYQMGKVGSSSLCHALTQAGVKSIHAHWITRDFYMPEFPTHKPHLVEGIRSGDAPAFKVITLVREPVARSISAYFQQPETYSGHTFKQKTTEQLYDDMLNFYRVDYPDLWFRHELLNVFNFDVYGVPFDHQRGYQIYKGGKHKLLVIRLEDANRCVPEAIEKFLGVKGIEMINRNVFKDRHNGTKLGHEYRAFTKMTYPEWYVNESYNLEHARHFYSKEEIERFREKWLYGETHTSLPDGKSREPVRRKRFDLRRV